jgi:hypothetical protein
VRAVYYLDFLAALHERLRPRAYLEIGVRHGDSLALARCPAVGIDPLPNLRVTLPASAKVVRETSDEYFERERPRRPLGGRRPDLAFIDGMHLFEFALRDFAAVERQSSWTSAIVFDDMLPRDVTEAARDRRTRAWTGDVYKLLGILGLHRPDLLCLRIDTEPTGLLVVLGLDPRSKVLMGRYDEILERDLVPDPQPVPAAVLTRRGALDPERVLASGVWSFLREARASGQEREPGVKALRRVVRRDLGRIRPGGRPRLLPVPA